MKLKNEVLVGVVVVVGIILLVVGAYWLSGKPWGEEQLEITAIFREVGQLQKGNPVKLRGVQVGRVETVELSETGQGVLVTMSISPKAQAPRDAAVLLAPASLFGDWQASLISRSTYPELDFTTATTPGVLPGATLPDITELTAVGARIAGDLETLANRVELAFTEETALKLRETIENVESISEQLTGFVDQQTSAYADVAKNVVQATANINTATARVERVAGTVEGAFGDGGQVQEILNNARTASANLEELSTRLESATRGVPGMVARADTTLARFGDLANSASDVLDEVQPQVKELGPTLAQAREALATLQRAASLIESGQGTLGRLAQDPALYEETQAAIATLRRVLADVQANPGRYIGEVKIF